MSVTVPAIFWTGLQKKLPSRGEWTAPFNKQYINYSRDGVPNYNEISDIVARLLSLAEAAILGRGGRMVEVEGEWRYFVRDFAD